MFPVSLASMVAVSVASLLGIVCGPMENLEVMSVTVLQQDKRVKITHKF